MACAPWVIFFTHPQTGGGCEGERPTAGYAPLLCVQSRFVGGNICDAVASRSLLMSSSLLGRSQSEPRTIFNTVLFVTMTMNVCRVRLIPSFHTTTHFHTVLPPPSPLSALVRASLGWADGHPIKNHGHRVCQRYVLGEIVLQDMSIQLSAAVWRDLTSSFFRWEGASVVRELVRN